MNSLFTSIHDFNKDAVINYINKNKSASQFKKLDFLTQQGKDMTLQNNEYFSSIVDRAGALFKISKVLGSVHKALDIEAGIYEYAIIYVTVKNIDKDFFGAIYEDKLNDILTNIDPESSVENITFKKRILDDEIVPQEIAFMQPHEIHQTRWEELVKKKELIEYKKTHMAYSDLYTCKKCKAKKHHIMQAQTRSADEPMTTFATCLECGFVMKF